MSNQLAIAVVATFLMQTNAPFTPDSRPPVRTILNGTVTIPLQTGRGLPLVEVRINGQGPFNFGIETGANFIAISPALASTLKVSRTGGPDDFPAYRIERIDVGSVRLEEMTVYASQFAQPGLDGVLGLPAFRDILITLDYAKQEARFSRGDLPASNGADILDLSSVSSFLGVPLAIAGQRAMAIIDTRSPDALGVTPEMAASLPFDGDPVVIGMMRGAGLPAVEVKAGKLKGDVTIGAYTLKTPTINVRPLPATFPQNAVIGSIVLRQFAVTLDQRNKRMQLSRDGVKVIDLPSPMMRRPQ